MENNYKSRLDITNEEIKKIKSNSPESLPLNPTAQGFSGQEVRKKMYMALTGEEGSILALFKDRLDVVAQLLKELDESKVSVNGDLQADVLIGTVRVYTEELPLSGLRYIDGVQLREDDLVLVAGQGELNGIYIVKEDSWILERKVKKNQVVSINEGIDFGDAMMKKEVSGITKMVKSPYRQRWNIG